MFRHLIEKKENLMAVSDNQHPISSDQIAALVCLTLAGWVALIAMGVGFYTMLSGLF